MTGRGCRKRELAKIKLSTDMSVNPSATATNCTGPIPLSCSSRLDRSRGKTSLTVTYRSVPPANPCSMGMIRLVSVTFSPSKPMPIPIPATEPSENVNTCSTWEHRCRALYVHSCTPSAKPTTNLCALTAPSSNNTFGPEFCTPIANPSSSECMHRASNKPNTPVSCISAALVDDRGSGAPLTDDRRDKLPANPTTLSTERARCIRIFTAVPFRYQSAFPFTVIVCTDSAEHHQLVYGVHEEKPATKHNLRKLPQRLAYFRQHVHDGRGKQNSRSKTQQKRQCPWIAFTVSLGNVDRQHATQRAANTEHHDRQQFCLILAGSDAFHATRLGDSMSGNAVTYGS
uniref:Uncharacterized protein n=1 Tax=Anopheles culicifacies TaxID=139723 RepID=A0A182MAX1_9DIPT